MQVDYKDRKQLIKQQEAEDAPGAVRYLLRSAPEMIADAARIKWQDFLNVVELQALVRPTPWPTDTLADRRSPYLLHGKEGVMLLIMLCCRHPTSPSLPHLHPRANGIYDMCLQGLVSYVTGVAQDPIYQTIFKIQYFVLQPHFTGPLFVRIAFHDAATWNRNSTTNKGGCASSCYTPLYRLLAS